ncbi:shikimate kinase [Coraliomargarita sp. W4R53]
MDSVGPVDRRRSVSLIGMAGVGKSTVGRLLAERLKRTFVDTDDLIRDSTGQRLQSVIDNVGLDGFLTQEAEVIGAMEISDVIIATGGSAVYGATAMAHLKRHSWIVWLRQDKQTLIERIGDSLHARGLVMRVGQIFDDVIEERDPLYAKYQDVVIQFGDRSLEQIVEVICRSLK